jgi:hypothetical protein
MEGIPDRFERVPFTRSEGERSRRFFGLPTRANPRLMRGSAAKTQPPRKRERRETRGAATGIPEARSHTAPWEDNAHAAASKAETQKMHSTRVVRRPAEAVSGVVKRLVPRSHSAEPKTPWGVHAPQGAHGAGNARGAGAHDSIGWQTSVRRIARLPCRSIARSVGRSRALA